MELNSQKHAINILDICPITENGIGSLDNRLKCFNYYPQKEVRNHLLLIMGSRVKGGVFPHILFVGPPGTGKTTAARFMAEYQWGLYLELSAGNIRKIKDVENIVEYLITNPGSVLLIDEIHGLDKTIEEALYSIMQDNIYTYANHYSVNIPPFTLIGATTKYGQITRPLAQRFRYTVRFDFYNEDDLTQIVLMMANRNKERVWIWPPNKPITSYRDCIIAREIARRSKGIPRNVVQLYYKMVDMSRLMGKTYNYCGENIPLIDEEVVNKTCKMIGIDSYGLDNQDIKILEYLFISNRPVGFASIQANTGLDITDLEIREQDLVRQGFITRGPRGREITIKGRQHISKRFDSNDDQYYVEPVTKTMKHYRMDENIITDQDMYLLSIQNKISTDTQRKFTRIDKQLEAVSNYFSKYCISNKFVKTYT